MKCFLCEEELSQERVDFLQSDPHDRPPTCEYCFGILSTSPEDSQLRKDLFSLARAD